MAGALARGTMDTESRWTASAATGKMQQDIWSLYCCSRDLTSHLLGLSAFSSLYNWYANEAAAQLKDFFRRMKSRALSFFNLRNNGSSGLINLQLATHHALPFGLAVEEHRYACTAHRACSTVKTCN